MQVELSEKAKKDFDSLPKEKKEATKKKIESLTKFPFSGKKLGGELKNYYSLKIWPYRIIYEIYNNKLYIVRISHRQEAYK